VSTFGVSGTNRGGHEARERVREELFDCWGCLSEERFLLAAMVSASGFPVPARKIEGNS